MGERLLCKQEGDGSIPFTSTSLRRSSRRDARELSFGAGRTRGRGLFVIVNKDCWDTVAEGDDRCGPFMAGIAGWLSAAKCLCVNTLARRSYRCAKPIGASSLG